MNKKTKGLSNTKKKIFILDTSVILYDHNTLNNFHEHDVAIPIQVLEELDHFKIGNDTRNFEARSFIRLINILSRQKLVSEWININASNAGKVKVILNHKVLAVDAEAIYGKGKTDNKILNAALSLKEEFPKKKVTLVSKDICLRLKAKALNLFAEDYGTGKIKNVDQLNLGNTILNNHDEKILNLIKKEKIVSAKEVKLSMPLQNHFFVLKNKRKTVNVFYNHHLQSISLVQNDPIFKIKPKNIGQAFAIHALLNEDIKLVSIQGNAGTGKTLLALAGALAQRREFRQIYVTRPIVSLSNKDLGFLPGDAKSKTDPYMAPIWDNLRYIKEQFAGDHKMIGKIEELITSEKIAIAPLAFIRGRTLTKIFFIVDEAQNLTPHEVKTIISRAGEHTKIVFTGDIYQIDTPYLDSESNGLSYLIALQKTIPFTHTSPYKKGRGAN